jgi:hypothetical protein
MTTFTSLPSHAATTSFLFTLIVAPPVPAVLSWLKVLRHQFMSLENPENPANV